MAGVARLGGVALLASLIMVSFSPVPPKGHLLIAPENPGGSPVTIHAQAGKFGAVRDTLPSGQAVGRSPTEPLTIATRRRVERSVVAEDGSVLMTALSHNGEVYPMATDGEMAIGVYEPGSRRLQTIRFAAADRRQSVIGPDNTPIAPAVTDLLPLPGGTVAFTARTKGFAGTWPVFGVLTKVDGPWRADWTATTLGIDPPDRMARFKQTGDIVVTSLEGTGSVTVLRLTGHEARVMAHHRLAKPPWQVHTDPTSVLGAERFVLGLGIHAQEFEYDSRAGAIRPLSPPVLPGDFMEPPTKDAEKKPFGFGPALYDHAGNLWLARTRAGSLAVYTKRLCECRPDYDILQPRAFGDPVDLVEDAANGTIALLLKGGVLLTVRATGSGSKLSFAMGNPLDLGHKMLALREFGWLESRLAEFGPAGRLWIPTGRMTPEPSGLPTIDHLMISVRLEELFSPGPVVLSAIPGEPVVIQAERTVTTSTTQRRNQLTKSIDVDPMAYAGECRDAYHLWHGCEYDEVTGEGFVVLDDDRLGFKHGFVEYRVRVPADGKYMVSYRVATFVNTPNVQMRLIAGGRTYDTPVFRGGGWNIVPVAEPLQLTAGEHTIRLSAPDEHGGWFLNSFTLQRA